MIEDRFTGTCSVNGRGWTTKKYMHYPKWSTPTVLLTFSIVYLTRTGSCTKYYSDGIYPRYTGWENLLYWQDIVHYITNYEPIGNVNSKGQEELLRSLENKFLGVIFYFLYIFFVYLFKITVPKNWNIWFI